MMFQMIGILAALVFLTVGCSGKYLVRTYPSGARVYTRGIGANDKTLVGTSPIQISESSELGDVFFLSLEKQNFKKKEVLVRVAEGESLTVTAQLDPLIAEDEKGDGKVADKKDDDQKPGQPPQKDDKKAKKDEVMELKEEINELNLRVALLENTTSFYKDAMFSPRFKSGLQSHERDNSDKVVGLMFQAQQATVQNKYGEALRLIDEAIQTNAYIAQAWVLKGSVNYLQNDLPGARGAWERALKLDPHNKVAYQYLSRVYQKMGVGKLPENPGRIRDPASVKEIEKRRRVKN